MVTQNNTEQGKGKVIDMLNLNDPLNSIRVKDFECGRTQNIEVRIGRRLYMVDVIKTEMISYVELYRKVCSDRTKYSKYEPKAKMVSAKVKSNACLHKDFFENLQELKKAQDIYSKYGDVLAM